MRGLALWSVLPLLSAGVGAGRFSPLDVKPLGPPPSKMLSTEQLVRRQGYSPVTHTAVTEDGYLLGLTRILARPGPPVLMVNGMALGPEVWVLHGPGHDLAFVLAELGYDVWLGGQRGVTGSQAHLQYNLTQPEFWDFSHDESGYYDLPAMIDLVLRESGHSRLLYVGTSLGGTLFSVMCAERPEYCAAVAGNVQYVPAVYMPTWGQLPSLTRFVLRILKLYLKASDMLSVHHVLMRSEHFVNMVQNICASWLGEDAFFLALNFVVGFNRQNMADGWLGYTLGMSASGTSVRQVKHLIQLTEKGGSRKYDWGPLENLSKYGSLSPPSYDLSKITSPTLVYYSVIDRLLPFQAAMEKAIRLMGNVKMAKHVTDPSYGHAEHVFGKDLYKLTYSEVVDFFDLIVGVNSTYQSL